MISAQLPDGTTLQFPEEHVTIAFQLIRLLPRTHVQRAGESDADYRHST